MIQRTVKTRVVGIGLSIDETVYAIVDVRGNILAKDSFATTDFLNVNEFECVYDNVLEVLSHLNQTYVFPCENVGYQFACIVEFPLLCVHQEISLDITVLTTVFCGKVLAGLCDKDLRPDIDLYAIDL